MTQPPSASSGGAAPLSLVQRFFGMLTSPKATFENVVSWPRWFGMLALTTAITVVAVGALHAERRRPRHHPQAAAGGRRAAGAGRDGGQHRPLLPADRHPHLHAADDASPSPASCWGSSPSPAGARPTSRCCRSTCIRVSSGPSPGPSTPLINYFMASDTNVTSLAGIGNAHCREGLRPGLLQRPRPHHLPGAVRARDRPRRALPPADPAHLPGSLRVSTWSLRSSSAP